MKRVLITGATGAIGSALIKNLIERGVECLVLTHRNSTRTGNLPQSPLVSVLPCSLDEMASLQNETGKNYDILYHFAWMGTSGEGRQDLPLQVQNIRYALDAVELAKRFGCHTFIGAGSQAEYGRVEGELKPDTPTFPENGYGIAKLCAGQMTRERARQLGMRSIWVRILSVYGPFDGPQSMISSTVRKLLAGERAPFTKGEQMWDYLYSADAAEAFREIGERGKDGKIYVLGNGTARPLAEYIRLIGAACGGEGKIDLGAVPYAERQVMYLKADISELRKDTGWEPKTTFEEGIKMTVETFKMMNRGGV